MSERQRPKPTIYEKHSDLPTFGITSATMEWNETGTWRYLRPRYVERIPACQASCPTSNDIERWIRLMEKGQVQNAWDAALLENPLPDIMGRICFHPCMQGCNRGEMGGSVNINMLERYLSDLSANFPTPKPLLPKTDKRVAVIGSGPAGLACAYHLARLGHSVVIFEKEKKAGGILRYGIPSYRLPKDILDKAIKRFESLKIEFKLSSPIKDAAAMQDIRQEYDAVFIAIGAHKSKVMGIDGETANGVMSGLSMLHDLASGNKPKLGKKTFVIGGGNTAIDSARTAKRLGSDVTILYRRSKDEMPASKEEIDAAEAEGIKIELLVSPIRIITNGEKAIKLECSRMELGEPDESGRRRPMPIKGSEFTFDVDNIITAIGENLETAIIPSALHMKDGLLEVNAAGQTKWTNVFAGGDMTEQPRTAVDAMASGKISAIAIDCVLRKDSPSDILDKILIPETKFARISRYIELRTGNFPAPYRMDADSEVTRLDEVVHFEDLNSVYFQDSNPQKTPELSVSKRFTDDTFLEVKPTVSKEIADAEIERCFHCGRCTECDNCYIYCPDVAISKKSGGFDVDYYYCKGCGVCKQECPRAAIDMCEEPTEI